MDHHTTRSTKRSLPTFVVGCIVLSAALIGCAGGPQPVERPPAEPATDEMAQHITIIPPAHQQGNDPCALEGPIYMPDASIVHYGVGNKTEIRMCDKYTFTRNHYAAIIGKDAHHESVKAFAALFHDQSSAEEQAGIAACVAHAAQEEMLFLGFAMLIRNYVCAVK